MAELLPSRKYRAEIALPPSTSDRKVIVHGVVTEVHESYVTVQVDVSRSLLDEWAITEDGE